MTEANLHSVEPADEGRHVPSDDPLWNESHYLDFVAHDGSVAGYARIGLYPNLGVTWWTAMVVGPGRPLVASVAYDLPVPGAPGLAVDAGGYAFAETVGVPLDTVHVAGTVPGELLDDPVDVYRGSPGRPTTLALDLTWSTDGVPYHYDVTTRYEIPCLVGGTVSVGDTVLAVEGQGQRDHSWGVRDWWAFGWCWFAGRLDDGTRIHGTDVRIPGQRVPLGYVQHPDGEVVTVTGLDITEVLGAEGLPSSAAVRIDPVGLGLAVEPVEFGPLELTSTDGRVSRFPRAMARFTASDGRSGTGWIEWNQPVAVADER
ncbi:MAG: hypothetical protein ABSF84_10660 [Acidimicrobiales bacterium]|jgi:hypothetical protein